MRDGREVMGHVVTLPAITWRRRKDDGRVLRIEVSPVGQGAEKLAREVGEHEG